MGNLTWTEFSGSFDLSKMGLSKGKWHAIEDYVLSRYSGCIARFISTHTGLWKFSYTAAKALYPEDKDFSMNFSSFATFF